MIQPIANLKPQIKLNEDLKEKVDSKNNQIFTAEVTDIILDKSHPLYKSDKDICVIEFYSYSGPSGFAYPLNFYIQKIPLKHESVLIISATNTLANESPGQTSYYYIDSVSAWNILNFNPTPFSTAVQPATKSKSESYSSFSGNTSQQSAPKFGSYFKSKANISSLMPFEGDVIFQGRWGNTIRFGSFSPNKTTWSKDGKAGDPIIIISVNGKEDSSRNVRIEKIDEDPSSIYICENQKIEVTPISSESKSFGKTKNKPQSQKSFKGNQIIVNSGRLFFQSTSDSLILGSKKAIHLSALESLNLDAKNDISLNSGKTLSLDSKKIVLSADDLFFQGKIKGTPKFEIGANGIFTTFEGRVVTVTNGLIIDIS